MSRFVLLSFVFLGWGFYELSGGSEFEPMRRAAPESATTTAPPTPVTVTATANPVPTPPPAPVPTVRRDLRELVTTPQPTPAATPAALSADSVLIQPAPEPTLPQAILPPPLPEPPEDIRSVRGARVNMRSGPGTAYSVLATLTRDQQVIVLREPGNGWAKLKVVDTGRIGWMSSRLLTRPAETATAAD